MLAGIGKPPEELFTPTTFVTNISSVNTYNLCAKKWHFDRPMGRIRPIEKTDFLHTGTVGHDAIQDLHQRMGEWDPPSSVGIAKAHADRLRSDVLERGHLMFESERDKRTWFADWLEHALPEYARKYKSVPWEYEWLVEEAIWLHLDADDTGQFHSNDKILIVGRPDAVVTIRGKLWHVQRKFFSEGVDLVRFCEQGTFQKHEVFYLTVLHQLSEQGEFDGTPVGHTLFDLLRKLTIPQHPTEAAPPKGCAKCNAVKALIDGEDDTSIYNRVLAAHPKYVHEDAKRHIGEAGRLVGNYRQRLEDKQTAWDTWVDRAFYRSECIITKKQRGLVFKEILEDIEQMMAINDGTRTPTSSQGWPCNAYFRQCPYQGVCAGIESIRGPQFSDRPKDYADNPMEAQ